jgi:glycyl-tRNA synthetase beta chain
MPADLLFEIGCEELPARSVDLGIEQLRTGGEAMLEQLRLAHGRVWASGTPRRLVLYVSDVADMQETASTRRRGPAAAAAFDAEGNPTKAAIGFAAGQGVTTDSLIVEEDGQSSYVWAVAEQPGREAAAVLPEALSALLAGLAFPKSMRWGMGSVRFVRPVRWIVALLGPDLLELELDGVSSGCVTSGHRFLAPNVIEIPEAAAYMRLLADTGQVMLDHDARADAIAGQCAAAAEAAGWRPVMDDPPLSEVVNLVEMPHTLLGRFKEEHVGLPREVLVTAMESHQRYFPVEDAAGTLAPGFLVVHNGEATAAETIVRGHERVLQARLSDAEFFFAEDTKRPLGDRVEDLKRLVYHERLGSVYEKARRVAGIADALAKALGAPTKLTQDVVRAAMLAKADLVTDMVIEFPKLQGVMGREYALRSGEAAEVADAISEHYLPKGPSDPLPQTEAGRILSVADKTDAVVSGFAAGFAPTGSEDPYALRRQGLGIVRIAVEERMPVGPRMLVDAALAQMTEGLAGLDLEAAGKAAEDFLIDRFKSHMTAKSFRYDRIDAVVASGIDDLGKAHDRVIAITAFLDAPDADDLITGFTRARNLCAPELGADVNPSLMTPPELALLEAVETAKGASEAALAAGDYPSALEALAGLRAPVDQFFIDVLVMAPEEDLKKNRLRLLNRLVAVFEPIADFSRIVQDGTPA